MRTGVYADHLHNELDQEKERVPAKFTTRVLPAYLDGSGIPSLKQSEAKQVRGQKARPKSKAQERCAAENVAGAVLAKLLSQARRLEEYVAYMTSATFAVHWSATVDTTNQARQKE